MFGGGGGFGSMLKILLILFVRGGMRFFTFLNSFYVSIMFLIRFLMIFVYRGGVEGGIIFSLFVYGGYDFYSYYLTIMRVWVVGLMYLSLGRMGGRGVIFMFYFVLIVLVGVFCVLNLLVFYFFFEVTLIPTFFIIIF